MLVALDQPALLRRSAEGFRWLPDLWQKLTRGHILKKSSAERRNKLEEVLRAARQIAD